MVGAAGIQKAEARCCLLISYGVCHKRNDLT